MFAESDGRRVCTMWHSAPDIWQPSETRAGEAEAADGKVLDQEVLDQAVAAMVEAVEAEAGMEMMAEPIGNARKPSMRNRPGRARLRTKGFENMSTELRGFEFAIFTREPRFMHVSLVEVHEDLSPFVMQHLGDQFPDVHCRINKDGEILRVHGATCQNMFAQCLRCKQVQGRDCQHHMQFVRVRLSVAFTIW